jgi:hypothetical protein
LVVDMRGALLASLSLSLSLSSLSVSDELEEMVSGEG